VLFFNLCKKWRNQTIRNNKSRSFCVFVVLYVAYQNSICQTMRWLAVSSASSGPSTGTDQTPTTHTGKQHTQLRKTKTNHNTVCAHLSGTKATCTVFHYGPKHVPWRQWPAAGWCSSHIILRLNQLLKIRMWHHHHHQS
jgi:hypothetical protein